MKTVTTYTDWQPGDTAKFYRQPRRIGPVGSRKVIPGRWGWGIIQSITGNLYDQDDNGVIGPFRLATLVNPLSDERAFVGVGDLRPAGFELEPDWQMEEQRRFDETVAHMGREI